MDTLILSIFGYWQFAICLFAFMVVMAIWYHIGNRQNDFGQVWLVLSILCWSFSGLVDIYFGSLLAIALVMFAFSIMELLRTSGLGLYIRSE